METNDELPESFHAVFYRLMSAIKLLKEISEKQKENFDPTKKEVGDRVKIWDYSYCTDFETCDHHNNKSGEGICIVISTNETFEQKGIVPGDTPVLDLVLFSPALNKKIRTSSEFVKGVKDEVRGTV